MAGFKMGLFFKNRATEPYAIAMAVNAHYCPYALVAYASLLEHCSVSTHLSLLHCGLSEEALAPFAALAEKMGAAKGLHHRFSAIFIAPENVDLPLSIDYISVETYLRFFIPARIPAAQCLYLDADLLINGDIAPLLRTALKDAYLGGVKDEWMSTDPEASAYIASLGNPSLMALYVNAGVLLFNSERMRALKLEGALFEAVTSQALKYQDQDALNLVCAGHVRALPERFNWATYNMKHASPLKQRWLRRFPPCVLHFTGPDKPWNTAYHEFRAQYCESVNRLCAVLGEALPQGFRSQLLCA